MSRHRRRPALRAAVGRGAKVVAAGGAAVRTGSTLQTGADDAHRRHGSRTREYDPHREVDDWHHALPAHQDDWIRCGRRRYRHALPILERAASITDGQPVVAGTRWPGAFYSR